MVLSIETASSLMRTICSRCRYSNTLSSTPFFDHRFIRVYTVCQLPNRLGNPRHFHAWKKALTQGAPHLFENRGGRQEKDQEVLTAQLYQQNGRRKCRVYPTRAILYVIGPE